MNKLLVITGGTKGIGRAIIDAFAIENFDIITCSRNESELKDLKKEIEKKNNNIRLEYLKSDLSVRDDIAAFVRFVSDRNRDVDVLVNNTGVFIPGMIHKEDEGILEHLINTNLYSAYHVTRGLLPQMIVRKSGYIFNICSTASIMPYINGGSYCISKYAMLGMTKVLREEMKEYGIKVTAVLPGATRTNSWAGTDLPEERFMKPEDVGACVINAYLLSKNSVIEELLIRPQKGDI